MDRINIPFLLFFIEALTYMYKYYLNIGVYFAAQMNYYI